MKICDVYMLMHRRSSNLLDTLVEELETGVAVADEGALLDELSEHLGPRQLAVKLLLRSIPRLQKTCSTRKEAV